jgi:O-antigen/teichoic acid export membrane protein
LLVWSVTGILSITNLGLGEATLRYVAHYHADGDIKGVNRVFGSTLSFYLIICVIVSAVLFPATPWMVNLVNIPAEGHHMAGWLLRFSALLFSLGMISNAFRSIPMALQRYDVSSKISFGQSVMRSSGFIVLVILGFGVVHLVLWEVLMTVVVLCLHVGVARWLMPDLRWLPRLSFAGLRETLGYGIFSFLTYIFLSLYRESGKLILGNQVGPKGVAYLGTPDSVAFNIHTVLINGVETLLPKFSSNRDRQLAYSLVANATWTSLAAGAALFTPLAVLMPDFLRLWINPEFARESAAVGQLLALSFIGPAGFSPIAAFFRGTGKPGVVTIVMAAAAIAVLSASFLLVPEYGALGVGYGYLISSVAWLLGLLGGWFYLFGASSWVSLIRAVGVPLLLAVLAFTIQCGIRSFFSDINWLGLFVLGGAFAGLTGLLIFGLDLLFGGDSFSGQVLKRLQESGKIGPLFRYLSAKRTP